MGIVWILIELFVNLSILDMGIKNIRKPARYDQEDPEGEKIWYYSQYIYGKYLIILDLINLLFFYPKAIVFIRYGSDSNTTFTLKYDVRFYEVGLLCLIPVLLIAVIARFITRYQIKRYDSEDLTIPFNQSYDLKITRSKNSQNDEKDNEQNQKITDLLPTDHQEELEKAIRQEKNHYSKCVSDSNRKKKSLNNDQINQYTSLIEQYHSALYSLNLSHDLGMEIIDDLYYYRKSIRDGIKEDLMDGLLIGNSTPMITDLDIPEIEKNLPVKKNKLLKHYRDYQKKLAKIDQFYHEYSIAHESANDHLIVDSKILTSIDQALFLSKLQVEAFTQHTEKARDHLLEELLVLYKKRNEICKKIPDNQYKPRKSA